LEANSYRWALHDEFKARADIANPQTDVTTGIPTFRFRSIDVAGGRAIAETEGNDVFCAAFDREAGRLVYLSVPHGLTISRQVHPVVPRLFAHLTRGLMPVEVDGDVEWLLNRTADGWLVALLNPAGQDKPQHGITPTDYRENREVVITASVPVMSAGDWLVPDEELIVESGVLRCVVPAGGVRIVELH
jgi:hypothetical protein